MIPIRFQCRASLPLAPQQVAEQILDLQRWPAFRGWGPIPGIRQAEFDSRTPEIVGTRIRVTNGDGSTHIEEITEWDPERRLQLRMENFTPPLSRLATRFVETWLFERHADATHVVRQFELYPGSILSRPAVWFLSFFLKQAIQRHLRDLRRGSPTESRKL